MVAIGSTGIVDQQGELKLSRPLALRNQAVKVLILIPDVSDDTAWLSVLNGNHSFDFLNDEAEDIYSSADGSPIQR